MSYSGQLSRIRLYGAARHSLDEQLLWRWYLILTETGFVGLRVREFDVVPIMEDESSSGKYGGDSERTKTSKS